MLRVIALAALAALAAGCTVKDSCAGDTVLVSLTLDAATAQADELVIDVALDGAAPLESSLAHTPGAAAGNVVIKFPAGYPKGHTVAVTVIARAAGADVGQAAVSVTLSDSCEAITLLVAASGGGDDLSTAADDLSAPPDLTPPADLAHCVPTTENCFNGIDDDCDGHIDCDDPDCPASVAVCVPAVTSPFVVGTTLNPISLCPTSYSSLEVINSGLTAAANCSSGCTCGVTCFTQLYRFNNASDCSTDNENQFAIVNTSSCASWSTWNNSLDVHMLFSPTQCSQGGTPVLPTVSWGSSSRVCSTTQTGGGCTAGNICVPATPGPKCEVASGSHSCDTGYNAVAGPWYLNYSDTRQCSCSCGAPAGNCGSNVTLYTDSNCTSGATAFAANAQNNIFCPAGGPFSSGKIAITPPTCGGPTYNPETGSLTPTNLQTLCCTP